MKFTTKSLNTKFTQKELKIMEVAKQKKEAIERMQLLKLHPNVIEEFKKDNIVNLSEGAMLYWLNSYQQEIVEEFQSKYYAVVYHVIHNFTHFGEMYALLYVSAHEEEWQMDKDDLRQGCTLAYVKTTTDEWCSEFGSIGIKPQYGGLLRTA